MPNDTASTVPVTKRYIFIPNDNLDMLFDIKLTSFSAIPIKEHSARYTCLQVYRWVILLNGKIRSYAYIIDF